MKAVSNNRCRVTIRHLEGVTCERRCSMMCGNRDETYTKDMFCCLISQPGCYNLVLLN